MLKRVIEQERVKHYSPSQIFYAIRGAGSAEGAYRRLEEVGGASLKRQDVNIACGTRFDIRTALPGVTFEDIVEVRKLFIEKQWLFEECYICS